MGKIIKKRIEYGGSSNSAENIKYDDTKNVKEAITEVKSEIADVHSNLTEINSNLTKLITGTIASGETSITLTDSRIKTTSIVDIYFENKVLAPTSVTVNNGSIVIEIDEQDSSTNVGVRCL